MANAKVLIVEDEDFFAKTIQDTLMHLGVGVSGVVSTGEDAVRMTEETRPDLVLMDIVLKGEMDGVEAAEQIHERFDIPVIYLTGLTGDELTERAKTTGPFGYILKPFQERELHVVIELALYKHETEKKLMERDKELERLVIETKKVNKEIRDFINIVSHDLKAPLRAISQLASWIADDNKDRLDEKGKEHLDLLLMRTRRMHNMLDGLLEYSNAGRIRGEAVQVDTGKIISEVIKSIASPENIHFLVHDLPKITIDPHQISLIFKHLIENSVRFMDKPEGTIEIGFGDLGSSWELFVKDNGKGIEERHFERIFQIFQTLSPRDQLESIGVGLAIVKKLVELNGGNVAIESEIGKGSTIRFKLPKD